jgi:thiamine-phosphate pyrophosphorylase
MQSAGQREFCYCIDNCELRLPRVYPILDTASLDRFALPWPEAAEALLEGGAGILQFRHKEFWSGEVVEAAERIGELCRQAGVPFVINDRADYAAMLGAALHLGQDDLTPADARTVMGPDAIIGYSTHNPQQVAAAQPEPVDYVAFGPIFGTSSKKRPDSTVGIVGLQAVRKLTELPLVAIGGVTLENAGSCWAAGADSVAIIAGLLCAPYTRLSLRRRMEEWLAPG